MRMCDIRRYEMLVRLKGFGASRAERFPATSGGGTLFAALDAKLDTIESRIVAQATNDNAAHQGTSVKKNARLRLRKVLGMLARTGKVVTANTPGLADTFRLPTSQSDQRLVAAGRAIVQNAGPFNDAIVAHNLPPTFVADVTAAIDAFEAATQAHVRAVESRAAARAMINEELAAGSKIADQLDAIVANACGSDTAAMAEWNAARHLSRVSVPYSNRKQPAKPATAPAPTSNPAPASNPS